MQKHGLKQPCIFLISSNVPVGKIRRTWKRLDIFGTKWEFPKYSALFDSKSWKSGNSQSGKTCTLSPGYGYTRIE